MYVSISCKPHLNFRDQNVKKMYFLIDKTWHLYNFFFKTISNTHSKTTRHTRTYDDINMNQHENLDKQQTEETDTSQMEKLSDTECKTTIVAMLMEIEVGLKNFRTRNQDYIK